MHHYVSIDNLYRSLTSFLILQFSGGCKRGDGVDDTPPQQKPSEGCPAFQDSCPGGGPDSVHNYMDYSNPECRTEFTKGQMDRMISEWRTYRS